MKDTCVKDNPAYWWNLEIFQVFWKNMYNFMHFDRGNKFFIYVCLPYLKFSDPLPKTHNFYINCNKISFNKRTYHVFIL